MGNNNRDYELMHYGVKGMRWGVRKKIQKTAIKSARSAATAKELEKITKEVRDQFRGRAAFSREMIDYQKRSGANVQSFYSKIEVPYQEKRAAEVYSTGMKNAKAWLKKSEHQKQKAYNLAKKYNISDGKAEIDRIMDQYGNTPYSSVVNGFRDVLYKSP